MTGDDYTWPLGARQTRSRVASALLHSYVAEQVRLALQAGGVPCAYLKGVAFLDTLYAHPAERPLADVDVLVPRAARHRVVALLTAARLEAVPPPRHRRAGWDGHYNWQFRAASGPKVEIHFGFAPHHLFSIDYEEIWSRVVERRANARVIPTLDPEDTLLALSIHDAKHAYEVPDHNREDTRRVINHWQPDWEILVTRARRWGATCAAYITLLAVQQDKLPIPEHVLAALRPSRTRLALLETLLQLPKGAPRRANPSPWARTAIVGAVVDRWSQAGGFASYYAYRRGLDALDAIRHLGNRAPG
jgi:hypothetical protein